MIYDGLYIPNLLQKNIKNQVTDLFWPIRIY